MTFFVEIDGFEPTTLCLQSRCSSQLSYTPVFSFLFGVCCVRLRIVRRSLPAGNSLPPRFSSLHPSKNKLQKSKDFFLASAASDFASSGGHYQQVTPFLRASLPCIHPKINFKSPRISFWRLLRQTSHPLRKPQKTEENCI